MHHHFCLTMDTDPDGLSGLHRNRNALSWESLASIRTLPEQLAEAFRVDASEMPITWFVRADGQIRDAFGSATYLLEKFGSFWDTVRCAGHELAWHPHLYQRSEGGKEPEILSDPSEASDELHRVWEGLGEADFRPSAFRNGEAWHHPSTFLTVESLGFQFDSTALPGCSGPMGHPRNWLNAPNQPYYPDERDLSRPGKMRPLLELPMTTWYTRAPYDQAPRLRYMNPAVHEQIFEGAADGWRETWSDFDGDQRVWVLILHPDEVAESGRSDLLYSHSYRVFIANLRGLVRRVLSADHTFEFATLSQAANAWMRANVPPE